MMLPSGASGIIIKSCTSFDRFAITIKCDVRKNINHALADRRNVSSIDGNIFKQLNSFVILCFRNCCRQIAVEFSSRYIQSDDIGICIITVLNKNIACAGSHISRQSCAINQCNGRRCRVIGDVASDCCIVRDNDRGRIALIRFTISDYNIPIDGAVFTRNIQLGFIVTSLSFFVAAYINSTVNIFSTSSRYRSIGHIANSVSCIGCFTPCLATNDKCCNWDILCTALPIFSWIILVGCVSIQRQSTIRNRSFTSTYHDSLTSTNHRAIVHIQCSRNIEHNRTSLFAGKPRICDTNFYAKVFFIT